MVLLLIAVWGQVLMESPSPPPPPPAAAVGCGGSLCFRQSAFVEADTGYSCSSCRSYPIFHLFEKNLTKAQSNTTCQDVGYTKYNSTVTHGGFGLDVTLDLYECAAGSGICEHPNK
jgi:hypothetical protein